MPTKSEASTLQSHSRGARLSPQSRPSQEATDLSQTRFGCRSCDAEITPFISFGDMPLGNGFLLPAEFENEYFYTMSVGLCEKCGMVQLADQPAPEQMFNEHYAFFSSTSTRMAMHFASFAQDVRERHLGDSDPFVVELGSNDGIMLQNFANKGIGHLGVEPSANVAQVAREKGINTVCRFFNEQLAEEIVAEHGHADAVLSANVICHIADLKAVGAGVKRLLKPKGVFIYEDPYLGDILTKTSYDQIYDEHVFYFCVASVSNFFAQFDLEVVDVAPQSTHGGSMRYTIAHKGAHAVSTAVHQQRAQEDEWGLTNPESFVTFRKNVEQSRDQLVTSLQDLKNQGVRVVGYGATSKSTTVMNYCGIGPDLIEFISDTTPIKQGKFTPGSHIPVRPYEDFKANYPDYALLFAWNHRQEIVANEDAFRDAGGKWIHFVPKVIVEK